MNYLPIIKRTLPILLAPLLCLGIGARDALAQTVESVTIYQANNSEVIASSISTSEYKKDEYFNLARCQCSEPGEDTDMIVRLKFSQWDSDTLVAVVVGRGSCINNDNNKSLLDTDSCEMILGEENKFKKIRELGAEFDIKTKSVQLMGGDCANAGDSDQMNIYVFTDATKTTESWVSEATIQYTVDSEAPEAPKPTGIASGEQLVDISFDAPSYSASAADGGAAVTDPTILGYQVLCQVADTGEQAFSNPPDPEYEATINICGETTIETPVDGGSVEASSGSGLTPYANGDGSTEAGVTEAGITEAGVTEAGLLDAGVQEDGPLDAGPLDTSTLDSGVVQTNAYLDDKFVCSEVSTSPGTIRVTGLTNGVEYQFYVVTIDMLRNPSEPVDAGTAKPLPAEDLWERYKRSGGTAQGGYCSLAGDIPSWPASLVLFLGLALITRRFRGRRQPPRAGGTR